MNNFFFGKEGQEFESRKKAYSKRLAKWKKQDQENKEGPKRKTDESRSLANIHKLESLRFQHFYKAGETQEKKLEIEDELAQLKQEYPEFLRKGIRTTLGYFFMLSFLLAVLVINFVLIKQPVEYLASQAFPPGSWAVTLATILLPFVIILFELGICSQLFSAQMFSSSRDEIILWQRLANVIVWVTPAMLLGTSFALYTGEEWPPELYEIILLFAMGILAYVTDAGVVYGYGRYQNAFAFFWFRINHLRRQYTLRRYKKIFYQKKYQFTHACKNYEEAVNNHNQKFTTKVTFVPINVYFDDVYYEQLSISGKL
ncbi:MAG: hypothetical protein O4749_04730 [Trichodesmium sp. St5_bin2_1]|nr:hypothetical protein [Trichodesmium sp. St5_bin2_1]